MQRTVRSRQAQCAAAAGESHAIVSRSVWTPSAARVWRGARRLAARLRTRLPAPGWARDWRFGLVVGAGAVLRLAAIARSPFGSDDALLFLEAARAAHDHLLPGTGIYNSLLALNMPLYTFLLLPFVDHPFGMALVTALANVLAVALLYQLTHRYFGRGAALLAGLFFATACYDTWMSDFIWQQTIVIPLTLAVLWTLYSGVVAGKRHWLIPHAILLAVAVQVYPLTLSLAPVTLVGCVLAWRTISALDVLLAELCVGALFVPPLLFELASGGYDLPIYLQWLGAPKHTDAQAVDVLTQALGALPADYLGPHTTYASVAPWFGWLGPAFLTLWAAGTLWLLAQLALALAQALWRWASTMLGVPSTSAERQPAPPAGSASSAPTAAPANTSLAAARDGVGWGPSRARLLIVLWPLLLLGASLRHATPVYIHYMFVVTPVMAMIAGILLADIGRWWGRVRPRGWPGWFLRRLGAMAVGALVVSQSIVTASFVLALATGQAPAWSWGSTPIPSYAHALGEASAVAAGVGARQVFIAADPGDPYMGLYWAERQNDLTSPGAARWTSYVAGSCAILPAPGAASGLLLVTGAGGLGLRELLRQPGTRLVRRIPMARDEAFPLYQLAPNGPPSGPPLATVNGELRLDTATIAPAGAGLPPRLVTRWTVLTGIPAGPSVEQYHFSVHFSGPGGTMGASASCEPDGWATGEGVLVVVPLPAQIARAAAQERAALVVSRTTHTWYRPRIGTITLETAKELVGRAVVLPLGTVRTPGMVAPDHAQALAATIILTPVPASRSSLVSSSAIPMEAPGRSSAYAS